MSNCSLQLKRTSYWLYQVPHSLEFVRVYILISVWLEKYNVPTNM